MQQPVYLVPPPNRTSQLREPKSGVRQSSTPTHTHITHIAVEHILIERRKLTMWTHSQDQFTAMKIIKHLCVVNIANVGTLAAVPADAGGCKFFGTTALSCEDGAGGYINTFFNGEKWTEPTTSRSASARDVPAGTVKMIRPIIIQQ